MDPNRRSRDWLWLLLLFLGPNLIAAAQVPIMYFTYATLAFPGADGRTIPMAINNLGQIVGTYTAGGQEYGFSYEFGTFTNLGANVYPTGINDSGVVAGYYYSANNQQQPMPSLTLPNCVGCSVNDVAGINDLGETVGTYYSPSGSLLQNFALLSHGLEFLCAGTGATIYAISNSSLIAGGTNSGAGAFIQDGITGSCKTYAFADDPPPSDTTFFGVNTWGEAVGATSEPQSLGPFPIIFESQLGGNWADIGLTPDPGFSSCGCADAINGVNDLGQIVGTIHYGPGFVTSGGMKVVIASTPLSSMKLSQGQSATATITLQSVDNFSGAVTLACSISPAVAEPATCSFSPNPITPSPGGSASSTLTLNTTSPSAALGSPNGSGRIPVLAASILLPTLVFGVMVTTIRGRKQLPLCLSFAVLMLVCLPCLSCGSKSSGSGGGGGGGSGSGTTPGAYGITVSAPGKTSQTTLFLFTVQ